MFTYLHIISIILGAYSTGSSTDLVFLGHTSVVRDCANPDWPDQLIINYQFETVQEVSLITYLFIHSIIAHSPARLFTRSLTLLLTHMCVDCDSLLRSR